MFFFNFKATVQYWAGILSKIECKFSVKFSFSVFILDPPEYAEPCWSRNPLQFLVWRYQEHPAIMSSLFQVERFRSPPNMWSQNEMLRRRILKWRAGCQFHHHLAWRRHLSKMCLLFAWGRRLKRSKESNLKELLFDRAQKVKAWLNFSFWVVRLHIGGYHCNKPTFGCNL